MKKPATQAPTWLPPDPHLVEGVLRVTAGTLLSGRLVCSTPVRASHLRHYQLNSEISVVGKKINCSLTPAISLQRSDNYPPI